MDDLDDLIERLRARLADPARRVDVRPRAFDRDVATMDLGSLLGAGRGAAADLARVVDANRAGRPLGDDLAATVDALSSVFADPGAPPWRAPATAAMLEAAEVGLGSRLPDAMRRVYAEVADGGFGPGPGLLPLADAVATYHAYRVQAPSAPVGQAWPTGLLPVLRYDPGADTVELGTGRMVAWDPESLTERSGGTGWMRTFRELAPSFEAWLDAWVRAPTPDERLQAQMEASTAGQARAARAAIAAMTPQQRAAMGLPEVGWERVVWGGIGLEDDEP
jgi:hypothetical protein